MNANDQVLLNIPGKKSYQDNTACERRAHMALIAADMECTEDKA